MNNKLILSLLCFSSVAQTSVMADIRVGNTSRNYAADYNQVTSQVETVRTATADTLPISVPNEDLANKILNGISTDVNSADLDACSMIYPSGNFAWDKPTGGTKKGTSEKCVSIVEMRVISGTEDIVVATANVAAGDSINCNISDFPESGYKAAAGTVVFPADTEPTIDDVKKVMDKEQKKNAGIKIAAGLLVGGLTGNAAGKNDAGKDNILGSDKGKIKGTALGALSGAALMAGNTYGGKVGGDIILSTGVNAAAGGVVGNMAGIGDSVLRIEDCNIDGSKKTCLWGTLEQYTNLNTDEKGYYNTVNGETIVCNSDDEKCLKTKLIGISLGTDADGKAIYQTAMQGQKDNKFIKIKDTFTYEKDEKSKYGTITAGNSNGDIWLEINSGGRPHKRINAMIVDFKDKKTGFKLDDWAEWKNKASTENTVIVGRTNTGNASTLSNKEDGTNWDLYDFYPLTIDADDGKLIDMSNKARLKGTAVGAAAGGGLGAFTAYQGAQDDITQRWISAVQEYKDSLQKVYCATGTRFLSSYNDVVIIPNVKITE